MHPDFRSPATRPLSRACKLGIFCAAAMAVSTIASAQDLARYHTHAELTTALRAITSTNQATARLTSIGKTLGGRDIWVVEIASRTGAPAEQRPGLFIAANLEGDQLIGSALALQIIDGLVKGYAANPDIKARIDNHVFYVIPRVNPDAAELMFAQLKTGRRTNAKPHDSDNDGRIDEDGPDDLNGDGQITLLRVLDPKGPYRIDPAEPRLMTRADPRKGETGGYSLYWEGLDNDGDGFINEDGPGGIDINRNFQHEYPYYEADAGRHMISELESRAVMDFMLAHRNIAAVLTFGASDNLIVAPNTRGVLSSARAIDMFAFADSSNAGANRVGIFATGGGGRGFGRGGGGGRGGRGGAAAASGGGGGRSGPVVTVNTADQPYFNAVAEKYAELTGIRQQPAVRTPAGALFEFAYYQFGVPSFSTPGWGLPAAAPAGRAAGRGGADATPATGADSAARGGRGGAAAGEAGAPAGRGAGGGGGGQAAAAPAPGADAALLRWMNAEEIDGFVPWTKFTHPTLGAVEIGGFKPYAATNPPAAAIAALGASHTAFAVHLASLFPKVGIESIDAVAQGGGIYRVKARVSNRGFLPTALAHAVVAGSVNPTMVQLGVAPESIIAGSAKTSFFQALAGSGAQQDYDWLIKGKPGDRIELKVMAQKGGTVTSTITLK